MSIQPNLGQLSSTTKRHHHQRQSLLAFLFPFFKALYIICIFSSRPPHDPSSAVRLCLFASPSRSCHAKVTNSTCCCQASLLLGESLLRQRFPVRMLSRAPCADSCTATHLWTLSGCEVQCKANCSLRAETLHRVFLRADRSSIGSHRPKCLPSSLYVCPLLFVSPYLISPPHFVPHFCIATPL